MSPVWDDPRVSRGIDRMLTDRRRRLAAGEQHVGWKVAFGGRPAQERLAIEGPLIGFLTDAGLLSDGATVDTSGWTRPALEPEIAVHLGADVPASATREAAAAAVAGLGAAIELADVDPELADVEEILAGNLYHRRVLLGPVDASRAGANASGIRVSVANAGTEIAATDDPIAACGDLVDLVRHAAAVLASAGEGLRAGDVLIPGSTVPPVPVSGGDHLTVDMAPLGRLSVSLG